MYIFVQVSLFLYTVKIEFQAHWRSILFLSSTMYKILFFFFLPYVVVGSFFYKNPNRDKA